MTTSDPRMSLDQCVDVQEQTILVAITLQQHLTRGDLVVVVGLGSMKASDNRGRVTRRYKHATEQGPRRTGTQYAETSRGG